MTGDRHTTHEPDPNLAVYNAAEVAAHYGALGYLSAAERLLFDKYIRAGDRILDLGVGGGRTTPYLSSVASKYIGADYAEEMISVCRRRFPENAFVVANATRLSMFGDHSFDVVVMAFNGFDYVIGEVEREAALGEIQRVLRPGGLFIFSSHNPRAIWQRRSWNRERVDAFARRIARGEGAIFSLVRLVARSLRAVLAFGQSLAASAALAGRRLAHAPFWKGEGYFNDPAHGGLLTHYAVPWRMEAEANRAGFRSVEVVGDDYPLRSSNLTTEWYYYVFASPPDTEGL